MRATISILHSPRMVITALLCSEDGVVFDKPALGQVEVGGEATNILHWEEDVDPGVACSVIRDPTETDPARRLKMTYLPVKLNGNVPKSHHDWWAFGRSDLDTPEAEPGYRVRHGMGLATIRAEGFVSLDAGLREGAVCTKLFFSTGARLIVNGRCGPGGYIAAAVMDIFEEPWEGFGREQCIPFVGDSVNHAFAWRGKGEEINAIPGYIRICFCLKNAQLFSFRIAG